MGFEFADHNATLEEPKMANLNGAQTGTPTLNLLWNASDARSPGVDLNASPFSQSLLILSSSLTDRVASVEVI
jgi:hypothetical protein